MNYSTIAVADESELMINNVNGIVKVVWNGIVNLETAQALLTRGADFIEDGTCDKIILDRQLLEEFTTDARMWIKNDLFKNRAKRLASNVSKMAMIEPQSVMGRIVSKMISSVIPLIFPNLKTKKFSQEADAYQWLTS